MELDANYQLSSAYLNTQQFDAIIAVSGYECRSTYLATSMNISGIPEKIVFAYKEFNECPTRRINDQQFSDLGFVLYNVSSQETSLLPGILENLFNRLSKPDLNILIDYSSMSKLWYSGILNYFSELECDLRHVTLWFCYSPSEYTKTVNTWSETSVYPELPEVNQKKPVALILGLGGEALQSKEMIGKLDPRITFAFYADPAYDRKFVKDIIHANHSFIKEISQQQVIKYPIHDLNVINSTLTQLCLNLRVSHQLILAPVGPKPFSLMCFVLSARYPDIKLWKIPTLGSVVPIDRKPLGQLLLYKINFTSEEVDY